MNKNFMLIMLLGVGGLYFLTNVITEVKSESSALQTVDDKRKNALSKYNTTDSIGQEILDVTLAAHNIQIEAWNVNDLKIEFIGLFPNFDEMKIFIKERTRGTYLKNRLNTLTNNIEEEYLGGTIDVEHAKRMLDNFQ